MQRGITKGQASLASIEQHAVFTDNIHGTSANDVEELVRLSSMHGRVTAAQVHNAQVGGQRGELLLRQVGEGLVLGQEASDLI